MVCRFNNNILTLNAEKTLTVAVRMRRKTSHQTDTFQKPERADVWEREGEKEGEREGERAVKQQFSFKTLKKVLNLKK